MATASNTARSRASAFALLPLLLAMCIFTAIVPCCAIAAEEMTEAEAIAEIKRLRGTFSPRRLTQQEFLKTRRERRGPPRNNTEPRPVARVEMAGEQFGDEQLKLLKYIPTLESVYISNASVTDAGMKELKALPKLTTLTLYCQPGGPKITDAGIRDLEEMTSLTGLYLSEVVVTEQGFRALTYLSNLENLMVDGPGIDDAALAHLEGLLKLKSLGLRDTSVGDDGLAILQRLPALDSLGLNGANITDQGLHCLKDFPALTSLYLRSDKLSENALAHLKGCARLTSLGIGGAAISDASLSGLAEFGELQSLNLSWNERITDAGLKHLEPLKKLASLSLHYTGITDSGLHWLKPLPMLKELNIGGTAVTDKGFETLKRIPTLRMLNASDGMTTEAIKEFRGETGVNIPGR